mmetsp:Transcript_30544/g.70431  ORF Transcript_30544/g.70431 Transcript_30544/m.70431 type:complete len:498 (+) Transcript_30544:29-1522(+)
MEGGTLDETLLNYANFEVYLPQSSRISNIEALNEEKQRTIAFQGETISVFFLLKPQADSREEASHWHEYFSRFSFSVQLLEPLKDVSGEATHRFVMSKSFQEERHTESSLVAPADLPGSTNQGVLLGNGHYIYHARVTFAVPPHLIGTDLVLAVVALPPSFPNDELKQSASFDQQFGSDMPHSHQRVLSELFRRGRVSSGQRPMRTLHRAIRVEDPLHVSSFRSGVGSKEFVVVTAQNAHEVESLYIHDIFVHASVVQTTLWLGPNSEALKFPICLLPGDVHGFVGYVQSGTEQDYNEKEVASFLLTRSAEEMAARPTKFSLTWSSEEAGPRTIRCYDLPVETEEDNNTDDISISFECNQPVPLGKLFTIRVSVKNLAKIPRHLTLSFPGLCEHPHAHIGQSSVFLERAPVPTSSSKRRGTLAGQEGHLEAPPPLLCLEKSLDLGAIAGEGSESMNLRFIAFKTGTLSMGEVCIFDGTLKANYKLRTNWHLLVTSDA